MSEEWRTEIVATLIFFKKGEAKHDNYMAAHFMPENPQLQESRGKLNDIWKSIG